MAIGADSILRMGTGAPFTPSAGTRNADNTLSTAAAPGNSRQTVALNEKCPIAYSSGQAGRGGRATEALRHFDAFIETHYLNKLSAASRWQRQYSELRHVDNLFNEPFSSGLGSSINDFFNSWNGLSQGADTLSPREAPLGQAQGVAAGVRELDASLRALAEQVTGQMEEDVAASNRLMQEIAQINREIAVGHHAGRKKRNELMDRRDVKVRDLAAIIDIDVADRGPGKYGITMKSGNPLIRNDIASALELRGATAENSLTDASPYKARNKDGAWNTIRFSGADSFAYTVEMVDGGDVGDGGRFKASIDGGDTWLTNDEGDMMFFAFQEYDKAVRVGELVIWFDPGRLAAGDRFVISPKSDVYWLSPTGAALNVSTQIYADGRANSLRITGGSLGGLIELRDYKIGEYRAHLDALARSLAWEVNRIHSQAAGLEAMTHMSGTYAAGNRNAPLGSPEARFTWAGRLQAGNMNFAVYDAEGNSIFGYPGLNVLSIHGGSFDPAKHGMSDVVSAINSPANECSRYIRAEVADGRLNINAKSYDGASGDTRSYSFALTGDTTGLGAAFGLNCFFTGDSAASLGVNQNMASNSNLSTTGDARAASEIAALAARAVRFCALRSKDAAQSLSDYYGGMVAKVNSDTRDARFAAAAETAIAQDLYDRQKELAGVNLDEGMSNLIKSQASYKATAKLITTADEMLQNLLSLTL